MDQRWEDHSKFQEIPGKAEASAASRGPQDAQVGEEGDKEPAWGHPDWGLYCPLPVTMRPTQAWGMDSWDP